MDRPMDELTNRMDRPLYRDAWTHLKMVFADCISLYLHISACVSLCLVCVSIFLCLSVFLCVSLLYCLPLSFQTRSVKPLNNEELIPDKEQN